MLTSIQLTPETERRLDGLAARTGRTRAYNLRELIERGLDELEEYYLGADVLERVRKAEERTYSVDQVDAELGLDD